VDITINIDDMIIHKDLTGVSLIYKELYHSTNINADLVFISASTQSLNFKLPLRQFYKYWELLINRSCPKTSGNYSMTFLNVIFQNVSAITFLIDVVLTHKTEEKITEHISDVTRKENGFNIYPIADK
jgi:hypothetical protein